MTARPPRVAPVQPAEEPVDTTSELRNWIKDNATLLSNASLLISLAAVALSLLPPVGFIDPYLKALIFGAAIILLIELHHQWPEELQIHLLRPTDLPDSHSWRMAAFAFFIQAATLLFAIWAAVSNPIILFPLTAFGVVFLFRRRFFSKPRGWFSRLVGILSLIAVLLLSELLMVVVWAAVTDQQVTIELWKEDRPGLDRDFEPASLASVRFAQPFRKPGRLSLLAVACRPTGETAWTPRLPRGLDRPCSSRSTGQPTPRPSCRTSPASLTVSARSSSSKSCRRRRRFVGRAAR